MNNCRYQLKTQPHSSHSQILESLKHLSSSSRILEVGIASGYIGRCLNKFGFEITGVEKDTALVLQAKKYYHTILTLDLNNEDIPPLEPFDSIILADILEHLYDPLKLLKKVRTFLKDNGFIVISMPNIANWIVRLGLALGNFNYYDRGILDKDHIRFFTLKTARKLIREAGLEINNVYPTSMPFQLFLNSPLISGCSNEIYYLFARLRPSLFAYQFVFKAVKSIPS